MRRQVGWTLLSTHGLVLLHVARNPDATVREIAADLLISRRQVNTVLNHLEADGFIRRVRIGRQNRYSVNPGARMRHPYFATLSIERLLGVVEGMPVR